MEVFRSETKVGVFILVAFLLFILGLFSVGDVRKLWDTKKTLVILFPYADGITKGSPVWFAGLEVGEVTDVRLASGGADRIAVTVGIKPEAKVRNDSRTEIRSLGMMGAKYVEIMPGSPQSPELKPGDTLEGKSSSSLSEILESGQTVATRMTELVDETKALVSEIRSNGAVGEAVKNVNGFLVEARKEAEDLRTLTRKLGAFADTLEATGHNIKKVSGEGGTELTALLREMRETNKSLQQRIVSLESRLDKTLGHVDGGIADARGAVKGIHSVVSSNSEDAAAIMKHMAETSRHLEALSEDLRAHPWKIVWKDDGTQDMANPLGSEQWREKGRIGLYEKE